MLRRTGELLRCHLRRRQDQGFRSGGDEFALLTDAPGHHCEVWLRERSACVTKKLRLYGELAPR